MIIPLYFITKVDAMQVSSSVFVSTNNNIIQRHNHKSCSLQEQADMKSITWQQIDFDSCIYQHDYSATYECYIVYLTTTRLRFSALLKPEWPKHPHESCFAKINGIDQCSSAHVYDKDNIHPWLTDRAGVLYPIL